MARGVTVFAGERGPLRKGMRVGVSDRRERNDVQNDPQRLRPELETADQRDAVGHQRNDDDGADQISDRARNSEAHLERAGENDGFDGKEDEGEGRVDQGRNRRTDISEAGATRQEVDVDAAFCGMIGDRQAATEDNDADDENGGRGVGDAVIERNRATDRLQSQEGNGAERGIGNAGRRPAPGALGGEAERIILQRLVRNPLIILASDAVDPLPPCHPVLPISKRSSAIGTATPMPKSTSLFCGAIYAILRICALHNPRNPCPARPRPEKRMGYSCQTRSKGA